LTPVQEAIVSLVQPQCRYLQFVTIS